MAVSGARADTFTAGSLVIPMDTSFQNSGMLQAYGLVYALLQNGVPVKWCIAPAKAQGGVDLSVQADDVRSGAHLGVVSYRGGPFLVPQVNRDAALALIQAWQSRYPSLAVHEATTTVTATVAVSLTSAPKLSVFADGAETIAFGYLNAAGIPQSNGAAWPTAQDPSGAYPGQPDVLSEAKIAGPTSTNHADGALFDASGNPATCHLLSMHAGGLTLGNEAVAEVRSYLGKAGTQLIAQCQSATVFDNEATYGHLLTSGPLSTGPQPAAVVALLPASPFAQFDGTFGTVGGPQPSWAESTRYAATDVLLRGAGAGAGTQEVALSGYLDGNKALGHAVFLGGHQYTTAVPMTSNPTTQGVRLVLDALLASPCGLAGTQPLMGLSLTGPSFATVAQASYTFSFTNTGSSIAQSIAVTYPLPAGVTFVSATAGGTASGGTVLWNLPDLAPGASTSVSVTVNLGAAGTTTHQGTLSFSTGAGTLTSSSNAVVTVFYTGAQTLVADWVYVEPNGRLTDALAIADFDSTVAGRELAVMAPARGTSGPGRAILLRTDTGKELSSYTAATGRDVMGLPVGEDLVAGGTRELAFGEPLPVSLSGAAILRTGASGALWSSLPYGYPSYWNMGPSVADVSASSPGLELLVADWNGNLRLLSGSSGAVLSSYNTWTSDGDHAFGHPTLADVDGDGLLEAVVAGYAKGSLIVVKPTVAPAMSRAWVGAPLLTQYGDRPYGSGVAVADIDGDGWVELVVSTYGATGDTYAFNLSQPSGSVCKHRFHTAGRSAYLSPVIADVDGSGTKSIVSMSSSGGVLSVLRAGTPGCATAGGTVVWQHTIKAGDVSSFTPALYDVNGDGVLDVIAATNTRLEIIDVRNKVVIAAFEDMTAAFMPSAVVANADPASPVSELYVSGWRNSKVYRLRLPPSATAPRDWPTFMGSSARDGAR